MLPPTLFNAIFANDLYDSSVSFTVYLLNPSLPAERRYTYLPANSSAHSCFASLLFSEVNAMPFLFLDLTAVSSQYGRFVPNEGFKLVHYPQLLLRQGARRVLNPSFVPEIARVLHEAVSFALLPDLRQSVFFSADLQGVRWDFGVVSVHVLTVVLEVEGNSFDAFLATQEAERSRFWRAAAKRLQRVLPSQKRIAVHTRYFPVAKTPNFAMLLTQSLELRSTNQTDRIDDMFTAVNFDKLRALLLQHKAAVWAEMGLTPVPDALRGETVGAVSVVPVFVYSKNPPFFFSSVESVSPRRRRFCSTPAKPPGVSTRWW